MFPVSDRVNRSLQRFQAYLETLTFFQIDLRLRGKVSRSDVIQLTLIEAWQMLHQIEAMERQDQKRWLRRMLLNNLNDEIDRFHAQIRDVRREHSLEQVAKESAVRVDNRIKAREPTPSEELITKEKELRVLEALAKLPKRQKEAVVLKHYHNGKLAEIAQYLGCSINAAAGLHARGLAKLRQLLADLE
jgi:RNA polymerase sigma-70 factor (subfamily 1)